VFSFHLSHVAGMRRSSDGGFVDYQRGDGTEFHYTWSTTARYRERYGCLVYTDGCPGDMLPLAPRALTMHIAGSGTASAASAPMLPAYVVSSGQALCSAAVHGLRESLYNKAFEIRCTEGRSALEGRLRQGDICADPLQSRHVESKVALPAEVLDALDALVAWREPLELALTALGASHDTAMIQALVRALSPYLKQLQPTDTGSPPLDGDAARTLPPESSAPAPARPPPLRRRFSSAMSLRLSGSCSAPAPSVEPSFAPDALCECARVLRELCTVLFPALRGRAWQMAALRIVPMAANALIADPTGDDMYDSSRHLELAAIASFAQTVVERHGMLDAVARVCGHVRGGEGAVDLSRVFEQPSLFACIVGSEDFEGSLF